MGVHSAGSASQRLPLVVNVDELKADCLQAVLPICRQIPGWAEADCSTLQVEQLSGAMTNLVYVAAFKPDAESPQQRAIVRVFGGSDGLFNRDSERQIFKLVSDLNLGPRLLADFQNGRAEEFWAGHSITAVAMKQPWVASAIASAMATFHWYGPVFVDSSGADSGGSGKGGSNGSSGLRPQLVWDRLREWRRIARGSVGDAWRGVDLEGLERQVDQLRDLFARTMPPWLAFCHNDLQYGNMMVFARHLVRTASGNLDPGRVGQFATRKREKRILSNASIEDLSADDRASLSPTVRFIDYEYASFNHIGFDIANHWCEYAADYHSQAPHVLDFSRFPSPAAQSSFCQAYVRKLMKLRRHLKLARVSVPSLSSMASSTLSDADSRSSTAAPTASSSGVGASAEAGPGPTSMAEVTMSSLACMVQDCRDDHDIDVIAEQLRCAALSHVLLSHLHWGLWGLVQAAQSEVDFDFESYAEQRLHEYGRLLPFALAGELPDCGEVSLPGPVPQDRAAAGAAGGGAGNGVGSGNGGQQQRGRRLMRPALQVL